METPTDTYVAQPDIFLIDITMGMRLCKAFNLCYTDAYLYHKVRACLYIYWPLWKQCSRCPRLKTCQLVRDVSYRKAQKGFVRPTFLMGTWERDMCEFQTPNLQYASTCLHVRARSLVRIHARTTTLLSPCLATVQNAAPLHSDERHKQMRLLLACL